MTIAHLQLRRASATLLVLGACSTPDRTPTDESLVLSASAETAATNDLGEYHVLGSGLESSLFAMGRSGEQVLSVTCTASRDWIGVIIKHNGRGHLASLRMATDDAGVPTYEVDADGTDVFTARAGDLVFAAIPEPMADSWQSMAGMLQSIQDDLVDVLSVDDDGLGPVLVFRGRQEARGRGEACLFSALAFAGNVAGCISTKDPRVCYSAAVSGGAAMSACSDGGGPKCLRRQRVCDFDVVIGGQTPCHSVCLEYEEDDEEDEGEGERDEGDQNDDGP